MKKIILALCAFVALSFSAATSYAQAPDPLVVCDLNNDARIDVLDITMLRQRIGWLVAPGSLGDPTGDGKITINDVRACIVQCTSPNCATAPQASFSTSGKGDGPRCLVRKLDGTCVIPV